MMASAEHIIRAVREAGYEVFANPEHPDTIGIEDIGTIILVPPEVWLYFGVISNRPVKFQLADPEFLPKLIDALRPFSDSRPRPPK